MRLIETLNWWFERDVRLVTWCEVETVVDQPNVAEVRFTTKKATYTVTADTKHGESFLGCTCFDRTLRQMRDLAEGACTEKTWAEKTWAEIVEAITENEIGPVRTPTHRAPRGRLF